MIRASPKKKHIIIIIIIRKARIVLLREREWEGTRGVSRSTLIRNLKATELKKGRKKLDTEAGRLQVSPEFWRRSSGEVSSVVRRRRRAA